MAGGSKVYLWTSEAGEGVRQGESGGVSDCNSEDKGGAVVMDSLTPMPRGLSQQSVYISQSRF